MTLQATAVENADVENLFVRPTTSVGSGKTTWWVSDSDIIPQEYQDELVFWRDVFKKGQFRIGDIAREIVDINASRGLYVNQTRIFEAIGKFCGCSARTVRYYYETASFYSTVVREQYDMLPFSHFVFARSCGGLWRDVLDLAKSDPAMTENKLRQRFTFMPGESEPDFAHDQNPVCDFRLNLPGVIAGSLDEQHESYLLRRIADKASLLSGDADEVVRMVDSFEQVKQVVGGLAESMAALRQAIEAIKASLPEIIDALRQVE